MKKILSIIALVSIIAAGTANATSIAVNGNNPTEIKAGTVYTDQGATVTYNDGTNAPVVGDISKVNASKQGSYAVDYSAIDTDGSGETATATRTVKVVGGGSSRIYKIPSIVDYSVVKIGENTYQINTRGKNLPLRASSQIKWGKDMDEVSSATWATYSETITVQTDASSIVLWVKNSDSTGKTTTVVLK